VLLIPIAIAAFFLSQGKGNGSSDTTLQKDADTLGGSAAMGSPLPTAEMPESTAVISAPTPVIDSQAIKDSIRRARREAAAKKAAAESLKNVTQAASGGSEAIVVRARVAAQALLSDAAARKAFAAGATHKGGVLGTQRKGDLQTQIDALAPFLSQKRLSYEQFKSIVRESGVNLFDEFGRMLPNALQQFASGG
jgi:hypothetical protein